MAGCAAGTNTKTDLPQTHTATNLIFYSGQELEAIFAQNIFKNWSIKEPKEDFFIPESTEDISRLYIANTDKSITCAITTYKSKADTIGMQISFQVEEITQNQYQKFIDNELEEIFAFIPQFSDNVLSMQTLCDNLKQEYQYHVEKYDGGSVIEWGNQQDGVYATVTLLKTDAIENPMLGVVKFVAEKEYNYLNAESLNEILTVEQFLQKQTEQSIVKGRLKNIEPQTDMGDFTLRNLVSLPQNKYSYQKAILTDDATKQEVIVYILPTALSEKELKQERLHAVIATKDSDTGEKIFIVVKSVVQ